MTSDCEHTEGFRINRGMIWCGTCSYSAPCPDTWLRSGPEGHVEAGRVRPATGNSFRGLSTNFTFNGQSVPVIQSSMVAENKMIILSEERLRLTGGSISGVFDINWTGS